MPGTSPEYFLRGLGVARLGFCDCSWVAHEVRATTTLRLSEGHTKLLTKEVKAIKTMLRIFEAGECGQKNRTVPHHKRDSQSGRHEEGLVTSCPLIGSRQRFRPIHPEKQVVFH